MFNANKVVLILLAFLSSFSFAQSSDLRTKYLENQKIEEQKKLSDPEYHEINKDIYNTWKYIFDNAELYYITDDYNHKQMIKKYSSSIHDISNLLMVFQLEGKLFTVNEKPAYDIDPVIWKQQEMICKYPHQQFILPVPLSEVDDSGFYKFKTGYHGSREFNTLRFPIAHNTFEINLEDGQCYQGSPASASRNDVFKCHIIDPNNRSTVNVLDRLKSKVSFSFFNKYSKRVCKIK
jgi:hypothetical protein